MQEILQSLLRAIHSATKGIKKHVHLAECSVTVSVSKLAEWLKKALGAQSLGIRELIDGQTILETKLDALSKENAELKSTLEDLVIKINSM